MSKFANRIEIFNELTVLIISEMTTIFVDGYVSMDLKFQTGWAIIMMATFNIFLNIIIVAVSSFADLWNSIFDVIAEFKK